MPDYGSLDRYRLPFEVEQEILALRLLLARAGGMDSLGWWADESFTESATYLLDRLFPVSPLLAARALALKAAFVRHEAASPGRLHLFRLDADNLDRLALRFASPLDAPAPEAPIRSMEALREQLLQLIGHPCPAPMQEGRSARELWLTLSPPAPGVNVLLHRARALAWAYLEGAPGQAVFPSFAP